MYNILNNTNDTFDFNAASASTGTNWWEQTDSPYVDYTDEFGLTYQVHQAAISDSDGETFFKDMLLNDEWRMDYYLEHYADQDISTLDYNAFIEASDAAYDQEHPSEPGPINFDDVLRNGMDDTVLVTDPLPVDGVTYTYALPEAIVVEGDWDATMNNMGELINYAIDVKDGLYDDGIQFEPVSSSGGEPVVEEPAAPVEPLQPPLPVPSEPITLLPPLPVPPITLLPPLPVPGWNQNWALNVGHESTGFDLFL